MRGAARLGYSRDVAAAAEAIYEERIGRARADFDLRTELSTCDVDLLVVHSVDDERMPFSDTEAAVGQSPHAELLAVSGLTHRRTARDPEVVARIADFLRPGRGAA
jgi:hypothetical protein